jgi:hypothetical protein
MRLTSFLRIEEAYQTALRIRTTGGTITLRRTEVSSRRFYSATFGELPFGHKKAWANNGPAAQILGGWEWSNILGFYGGQPISVLLGYDNANVGNVAQRPNLVGNPTLSNPTPQEWFNTAAFAAPAPFTYGTAGRNISRGPGIRNWDIALARNFAITERIRLQFRAEAFNTPNFVNFGLPVASYSASNFGQVLSAAASREIQFSLKLAF